MKASHELQVQYLFDRIYGDAEHNPYKSSSLQLRFYGYNQGSYHQKHVKPCVCKTNIHIW